MRIPAALLLATLLLPGCSKDIPAPLTPEDTPVPPPGPAHVCSTDTDCTCSCALGAVNRTWYGEHGDPAAECKDGCNAKGSSCVCRDGACAALRHGEPDPGCTRRDVDALISPSRDSASAPRTD